jgi:hypothetical protein
MKCGLAVAFLLPVFIAVVVCVPSPYSTCEHAQVVCDLRCSCVFILGVAMRPPWLPHFFMVCSVSIFELMFKDNKSKNGRSKYFCVARLLVLYSSCLLTLAEVL